MDTLEFLQSDFMNNPGVHEELKNALQLYLESNITTRDQVAADQIICTKELAHYANTTINELDEAEGEIIELSNKLAYSTAECNEWKSRFGELSEVAGRS